MTLAFVSPRRGRAKSEASESLVQDYVSRAGRYLPVDCVGFESEDALLATVGRQPGRPAAQLVLLDSRGVSLSSEEFAQAVGRMRDEGVQRVVMAIGPADGWSEAGRVKAHLVVSLGRMTLPHELARVVLAEQVYRALTILAGHPYHCGH